MKTILVDVTIISVKDGSHIRKKFPLDEGMFKAIKSLSEEEQLKYFTEEYREWKSEDNRRRYSAGSLNADDPLWRFVHDIPDEGPDPAEVYEANERKHAVDRAIASLIPSQQVVIRMKYEEDLTPGEIAERLGISLSAVSHRLQRAEDILRAMLNDYQ